MPELNEGFQEAQRAFHAGDAAAMRQVLERHPELKARINDPVAAFNSPVLHHARSREMLDVLLDAGADINARSKWWAGGFGFLDVASPELAAYAIERGAEVMAHAAARLGLLDKLKELISADPGLVHARGGDGQLPLHFASTVPIAEFLLDHGAEIDARDVDHESTAAQYMVRSRQPVAKYLVGRGCQTDILMAAALGDIDLVRKHIDADPECVRMRVNEESFPMAGSHAGGTIYQWELGWHVSAWQVAKAFGHTEVMELIQERSPAEEKLLNACWLHDEAMVRALLAENPDLAATLPPQGRRSLVHAVRNNDTIAARLMLTAGLPVDTFGQHHGTPLHWAGWHGNAEVVRLILGHNPPLENSDNVYGATPLQWTLHGSENGWERHKGDYPAALEALLDAGAKVPADAKGTDAVMAVFRRRGLK